MRGRVRRRSERGGCSRLDQPAARRHWSARGSRLVQRISPRVEGRATLVPPRRRRRLEVIVVVAKKTEVVAGKRKGGNHPDGRQRSYREGGRGEGGRAGANVLHTPLHLLVNRINQRHHGLSPIPLRPASTFLNLLLFLLSHFHLLLSLPLLPRFFPLLIPLRCHLDGLLCSIAIYSTDVTLQLTAPLPGVARDGRRDGESGGLERREGGKGGWIKAPGHFGRGDRRLTMSLDTHYVASRDSTSRYCRHSIASLYAESGLGQKNPIDPAVSYPDNIPSS